MQEEMRNSVRNYKLSVICFTLSLGLSILGYLNPLHAAVGHDYLVNAVSFFCITLGLAGIFFDITQKAQPSQLAKPPQLKFSISIYTWLALGCVIAIQPLLHYIRYPDALLFPVICLCVITVASIVTSNIVSTPKQKRQFLYQLSPWVYAMLSLTFVIQLMQVFNYQLTWHGWPVTRLSALPDRMDGNFAQANHTAYGFLLGLCFAIYQLQWAKDRTRQMILLILIMVFSIGIALTKSRAVLLMVMVVSIVYFFAQPLVWQKKLRYSVGLITFFILSYWLGGTMLSLLSPEKISAAGGVSRIGMDHQRISLLHRAWLISQESPLVGVGWNNFAFEGLKYVDSLSSFAFSDNAHMFLAQIYSELGLLGVLCLLPITCLIIRSFHMQHSAESSIALAFVLASIIYGSFEYPFWYFRYLLLFAVFLALIEQKTYTLPRLNREFSLILASVFCMLAGICVYYSYSYWQAGYLTYASNTNINTMENLTAADSNSNALPKPLLGFKNYIERKQVAYTPVDNKNLTFKTDLFKRVLIMEASPYNLFAYAKLLSYNGDKSQAFTMYKAACRVNESEDNCQDIALNLKKLAQKQPEIFQNDYTAYKDWLERKNN